MKLAVVIHGDRPAAAEAARKLASIANQRGISVLAISDEAGAFDDANLRAGEIDAVIAIGGDGTVLRAARAALSADAPLLGINVGRKGFLADVEPRYLERSIELLASGTWQESPRMTVEARINDGDAVIGINDVVIEKVLSQRLISLEVAIDEEKFINYHADGLIIATPTGSTAYNLSAGGPLVAPQLEAMILSPVAPHSLFSKTLVLHPDTAIRCTVLQDRSAGVSVDGYDVGTVEPGDRIYVQRGTGMVRFIEISGRSFAARVKEKFHLNEDLRFYGGG